MMSSTAVLGRLPRPDLAFPKAAGAAAKAPSDMVHFLGRITLGYSEGDLLAAQQLGIEAFLDDQLAWEEIDDGGLDTALFDLLPTLSMSYRELFATARTDEGRNDPAIELMAATLVRQVYSPRQLYELMVEFWTNHFNVFLFDGPVRYLKTVDDRDHIRPHALGYFRDLLHANAQSPAMLYYLDNYSNTAGGPNENYARELMELHTLGVDGGYGEHDVKEVARCFTGWTLNPRHPDVFVFNPLIHDFGEKRVLGETIAANGGIEDGRQVLDILAAHPSTARFLAEKLCRRFISDAPPQGIVEQVADSYLASDGHIPSMLRTLLLSDEFFAAADEKFKRPSEFVTSTLRRVAADTRGDFVRVLFEVTRSLGQAPYLAAPPTGYPDEQSAWLSTSSLLERWNFATAVAFGDVPVDGMGSDRGIGPLMGRFIAVDVRELIGEARRPVEIVDTLVERVLHRDIEQADRRALIRLARQGEPRNQPLAEEVVETRARAVLAAILSSEYFQRR